jgi:Na+/proline symporter
MSTLLLLLGVQSMYQKFYSAKTPGEARKAAGLWVIGTIIIETVVVIMAIYAAAYFWNDLQAGTMDHAAVVVMAAKKMIWLPVGVLLLGAATAVVISTGMNYLLSPTTTLMHDIYGRFFKTKSNVENSNSEASEKKLILVQKGLIILMGFIAYFMAWQMKSVLESAYFAYTIYGVAITPALLAALISKKVTRKAGLVSIISGTLITLLLKVLGYIIPSIMVPVGDPNGDPFGIPLLYPALAVSLLSLIVVSLLTKPPEKKVLDKFFPE